MLPAKYQWVVREFEAEGDSRMLFEIAARLESEGNLEGSATVYDRAFGLDPKDEEIRAARVGVLDALAVTEHGLPFRYVPGGPSLMGRLDGAEDECPWHPVWLSPFWMAETPVSWDAYCRLMDWEPPPRGIPRDSQEQREDYWRHGVYSGANRIRLQYCEDRTTRAGDWHSHIPPELRQPVSPPQRPLPFPNRSDPEAPWRYDTKPMVCTSWEVAILLAERLSSPGVRYALPTEAQWEKAARGGLVGMRYPWGDDPPTREGCDFGRFHEFSILPMKTFPPNDYGLYAMSGGVWEWTRDWYDRDIYGRAAMTDPEGPPEGEERVARGGSWADCAEAVTVSYRMAFAPTGQRGGGVVGMATPNVGFRLCRTVVREG